MDKNKSALYFSSNTKPNMKANVAKLLRIQISTKPNKYLGVNIAFDRKWNTNFDPLNEQLLSRAQVEKDDY